MISRLYGWSAKRSSASARRSSSRTNGWSASTISRIRSSIFGEVGLGDLTGELEVVVEAVLDRRADRVLGPGNRSHTACAITCAAEWRSTWSPSGSFGRTGSAFPSGAQAVSYTTGVPPVVGAIMMMKGVWTGRGVFNVEELPPRPFLDELAKQGLPWHMRDLEASEQADLFAVET